MSPEPYQYSDSDGDRMHIHAAGTSIYVEVMDRARSVTAAVSVPADERRAAAQALAGDEYVVVPAEQTAPQPADRGHAMFRVDARCPRCAVAEQPDRPEPVDPASVRVGQVVEIEADDGSWMVRARVADTDDPSHDGPPYPEGSPFGIKLDRFYWWPKITNATVRVLHAADPEPDPAAVEALYQVHAAASEAVTDEGSNTYRTDDLIRELVRRNVRVVSADA